MGRCATLVVCLALAEAAPAVAAPPWEEPRQTQLDCCGPYDFAFGASGRAIGVGDSSVRFHPQVATRSADGRWTARPGPRVGDVRLGVHADRVLLLGVVGFNRSRVTLTSGDTTGRLGKPRNLGGGRLPALAVDPSGAAVAAWQRSRDASMVALWRPAGGTFSRPIRLGPGGHFNAVAAAVNRHGEAVVMWRGRNRRTVIAAIDRDGRAGKPVELGRSGGTDRYAVVLRDDGRWVAAWLTQAFNKGGPTGAPWVSAFRGTVDSRSVASRLLERIKDTLGVPRLALELDSSGLPLIAWSAAEPQPELSGRVVRYASGDAGGEFGPPETAALPDRNVFLDDLETGPDGRAVLLLSTSYGPGVAEPPRIHARYRPGSGQPFGADEPIDSGSAAAVAFDPLSERPLAVWGSLLESFRGG